MNLGLCLTEGGEHIGSCSECKGCASCCKVSEKGVLLAEGECAQGVLLVAR